MAQWHLPAFCGVGTPLSGLWGSAGPTPLSVSAEHTYHQCATKSIEILIDFACRVRKKSPAAHLRYSYVSSILAPRPKTAPAPCLAPDEIFACACSFRRFFAGADPPPARCLGLDSPPSRSSVEELETTPRALAPSGLGGQYINTKVTLQSDSSITPPRARRPAWQARQCCLAGT